MRNLVLFTYRIREPDDPEEFARDLRARDYPAFRQNPFVEEYSSFRIVEDVQGEEWFRRFDLLFVKEPERWVENVLGDPVIAETARRFHQAWLPDPERPADHINASLAEEIWG